MGLLHLKGEKIRREIFISMLFIFIILSWNVVLITRKVNKYQIVGHLYEE